MFTVFAIILTIIAAPMINHGGARYTPISKIGCGIGMVALILWIVVLIALTFRFIAFLWVWAP